MPSLIQKHAHVKGQRSNHHIFKLQPNPSWAKKRPNRYTSFDMKTGRENEKGRSHMRPRMDFHLVLHGEYL